MITLRVDRNINTITIECGTMSHPRRQATQASINRIAGLAVRCDRVFSSCGSIRRQDRR